MKKLLLIPIVLAFVACGNNNAPELPGVFTVGKNKKVHTIYIFCSSEAPKMTLLAKIMRSFFSRNLSPVALVVLQFLELVGINLVLGSDQLGVIVKDVQSGLSCQLKDLPVCGK